MGDQANADELENRLVDFAAHLWNRKKTQCESTGRGMPDSSAELTQHLLFSLCGV